MTAANSPCSSPPRLKPCVCACDLLCLFKCCVLASFLEASPSDLGSSARHDFSAKTAVHKNQKENAQGVKTESC